MRKIRSDFNELILVAEKSKKKGGSMAAVFKLIQDLLEFEDKIQECISAQEMAENKQKIELFVADIDKMYDSLFEMARGGISSIRNQRQDMVDNPEEIDGDKEVGTEVEEEIRTAPVSDKSDKRKTPVMLNVPQIPKM